MPARWKKDAGKKRAADFVFRRCGKTDTVACTNDTHDDALEIALFLQFHDDRFDPTKPSARARIAWRNYNPAPCDFKRRIASVTATVAPHDQDTIFTIHAGRRDGPIYREAVIDDAVLVTPGDIDPEVAATITFVAPPDRFEDVEKLAVYWPDRPSMVRCACCWRSFPT